MRLLLKQRLFSWFDSFDIYDEAGQTVFTVAGKMAWGHKLEITDATGAYLGTVQQEVLTWRPRFAFYIGEAQVGELCREFAFFHPEYTLDMNGWSVVGDFWAWDYYVTAPGGAEIMRVSKEPFCWTDTYVIDIHDPEHALLCLMILLSIDADKCSQSG